MVSADSIGCVATFALSTSESFQLALLLSLTALASSDFVASSLPAFSYNYTVLLNNSSSPITSWVKDFSKFFVISLGSLAAS
jgi:hypothetical protein